MMAFIPSSYGLTPNKALHAFLEPPDGMYQRAEHVAAELTGPVNGKAKEPLRFSLPGTPRLFGLPRHSGLPGCSGVPGICISSHREAEYPVSLFPIAGHGSASEAAGPLSLSHLDGRGGQGQRYTA